MFMFNEFMDGLDDQAKQIRVRANALIFSNLEYILKQGIRDTIQRLTIALLLFIICVKKSEKQKKMLFAGRSVGLRRINWINSIRTSNK